MRVLRLDGSSIKSKADFLKAIADSLDLPDYFGHNWDALDECLKDDVREPTTVNWVNSSVLAASDPAAYEMAVRVFAESPVHLAPL